MDDPNAHIDIPQAINRLDEASITCPQQRLKVLCPFPPSAAICETTQCFTFFDRSWLQATVEEFKRHKWTAVKNYKRVGLTHLRHPDYGDIFFALLPWGAPAATCRMEELHAIGLRKFLVMGLGARLQTDHPPGSLFLIDQAVKDEGTSLHYSERSIFAHASFKYSNQIRNLLSNYEINFTEGLSWTTDAPYRETLEKFRYWQKKVCLVVEMEIAALFSFGKFYKIEVGALIIGADQLTANGWIDCFDSPQIARSKEQLSSFLRKQLTTSM